MSKADEIKKIINTLSWIKVSNIFKIKIIYTK